MEQKSRSTLPVKLGESDRKDLEALATYWRTTLAEAIRRAIRETLERINRK
jgi:hypothetical protein